MKGNPMEEHLPMRPAWDCDKCGQPWPCANAKSNLLREYLDDSVALLIYLALRHWDAFDDYVSSGEIPRNLHERFLGWAR